MKWCLLMAQKDKKNERQTMEWEVDEAGLKECDDMGEEAGLTTPPMSP